MLVPTSDALMLFSDAAVREVQLRYPHLIDLGLLKDIGKVSGGDYSRALTMAMDGAKSCPCPWCGTGPATA